MPITEDEIKAAKAPFYIVDDYSRGKMKGLPKKQKPSKVVGFSSDDPLGVGGGALPSYPVVHFEGGGWLFVYDLMRCHTIVEANQ